MVLIELAPENSIKFPSPQQLESANQGHLDTYTNIVDNVTFFSFERLHPHKNCFQKDLRPQNCHIMKKIMINTSALWNKLETVMEEKETHVRECFKQDSLLGSKQKCQ